MTHRTEPVYGLPTLTAYQMATAEMLDIHQQLDTLEVPNVVNGERLSAAQRVTVLVGAYKSACERIGR